MSRAARRLPGWLILFAVACGQGGALSESSLRALHADAAWGIVSGMQFQPQQTEADCGAAALAMLLTHRGHTTSRQEVTAVHPPEPERGILAARLRDYARAQGFSAFLISATVMDLERELSRGRSVLVGLVKRKGRRAYSHYEVVVGLRRDGQKLLMLDPASGWRQSAVTDFATEWEGSGRLALMVLPATR